MTDPLTIDAGQYESNRWTDWVVHVKWSTGSDGVLDIWKDGQPVVRKVGRNDRDSDGNYMKIGIYKWPWSQGIPSDTAERTLYHDELRIADERGNYDAVAPRGDMGEPTPGHLRLSAGLTISPATPTAGQPITASFQVTNDGGGPITAASFVVGTRDQTNANQDFPATTQPVTLQPGDSYTYQQTRSLAAGDYSGWPAFYDGADWHELGQHTTFTVVQPTPGHLRLDAGLTISPAAPTAGQPITASFQVTNDGGAPITVAYFVVGARDQANANQDFPPSPQVTLQPQESYTYQQAHSLAAGEYSAWPAYYDGTDWHELGQHITFTIS